MPIKAHSTKFRTRGTGALQPTQRIHRGHHYLLNYRSEAVRDFIYALKYERDTLSIQTAANLLLPGIQHLLQTQGIQGGCILCTIPQTPTRKKKEGYHHMHMVATAICRKQTEYQIELQPLLRWQRHISRQSTLNKTARQKNVTNALTVQKTLQENATYLIIDDVTTTGSTLTEAKQTLVKNGAKRVLTIALAH